MIGQNILHYRIERKLGEGGMGEVFLAVDTTLDRPVALKFLPRHFSSNPEARTRFQREAKALAALNHPNIVSVHEVGEFDGQPFIAMEYVEGQSLKTLIASGNIPMESAVGMMAQASDGLAAAHKRDIIHRDIKSENLFLSSEGRLKIMDFGLSTWQGVTKLTAEGSTLGTRAYMSPEQSMGGTVDHRSDLWSLGVIFYELITGRLPFTGEHDAAIAYSISSVAPEPLARYKAGVSPELQRIASKCLAKNPDERYQSSADLKADLLAWRSSSSVPTAGLAAPSGTTRRPRAALAWALSLAILAILAVFTWKSFQTETKEVETGRKMLAVLPFQNLGAEDQEYFADGMTEEITSRLVAVSGLGVISRTSVMQYKATKKTLREIGRELGVNYVLEGTVRWDRAGDKDVVRITPQLIRVEDDTHLWADQFDRPLDGVFAIQTDIAERVVAALDVALLEPERQALASHPTENPDAHNYYLRGLELFDRSTKPQDWTNAVKMYEKAIAADTQYALAYASLSIAESRIYFASLEPSEADRTRAREAAERALRLNPNLPQAHLAMGYYHYWGLRDFDAALKDFALAEKGQPNNSDLQEAIGLVKRRKGLWSESYEKLKRSMELDPMSVSKRVTCSETAGLMRRYREADEILSQGIAMYPDQVVFYSQLGALRYSATGDAKAVIAILDTASSRTKVDRSEYGEAYFLAHEYDSVVAIELRRVADQPLGSEEERMMHYFVVAEAHYLAGRTELSRPYFDSMSVNFRGMPDSQLAENPYGGFIMSTFYGRTGHNAEAVNLARQYYESSPLSEDAMEGIERLNHYSIIVANCGNPEQAIDLLDSLLHVPSQVSVAKLRNQALYDRLRNNLRFQALLDRGDIIF